MSEIFLSSSVGDSGVPWAEGAGGGTSRRWGKRLAVATALLSNMRLVKGFFRPVVLTIVRAGSRCGAGAPCLGEVVCDDGGDIALRLGDDGGEFCLGAVDWDEGTDTAESLFGNEA